MRFLAEIFAGTAAGARVSATFYYFLLFLWSDGE